MSHCHVPTCGTSPWTRPGSEPAVAWESWGTAAFIADIIVAYVLILVTRYTSRVYAGTPKSLAGYAAMRLLAGMQTRVNLHRLGLYLKTSDGFTLGAAKTAFT